MAELAERIGEALRKEEARAEQFANSVRFIFLIVLTVVALLNVFSVSMEANILNFGVLVIGYTYGSVVFLRIHRSGYHPAMKYITSCLDILLVYLLLFLYTRIEIPSVALKNPVFIIVFPLLIMTAFRYDRNLTVIVGGLAVGLYLVLTSYLFLSGLVVFTRGGYEKELFSGDVTYVGQATKILILIGSVLLLSYFGQYSRTLFAKLVRDELSLRRQKELMDWELNIASQVQTKFLPYSFPEIPGLEVYGAVQQGKFVGGDYFDFIKLPDETLLIVVADVSGKGVPAALIMAEVRASTHLLASQEMELDDFAQRVNLLVHQSTDKKSFVTFCAARVDAKDRRLTYINAGHPPPLICFEGKVHSLAKGTLPLGVSASLPGMIEHAEEFPPGAIFVCYTDGLTEQTNSRGDQFGEDRLREHLRANTGLNAQSFTLKLFGAIRTWGEGKDLTDDVSLAVVKHYRAESKV